MGELHADAVSRLLEWMGPEPDEVIAAMERRAERADFPTVGPEVGRVFALCTRLSGARSVLELGSGFGYAAYWIARALPTDGSITLTERDRDLLDDAEAYFERGGLTDRATFWHGDALEFARDCSDSFDMVVLDHDTAEYVEGFEVARDLIPPGGAILIDNVAVYGEILTPDSLRTTLAGETPPNERTAIGSEFLTHLRDEAAFETYLLPVGEGVAVAYRLE